MIPIAPAMSIGELSSMVPDIAGSQKCFHGLSCFVLSSIFHCPLSTFLHLWHASITASPQWRRETATRTFEECSICRAPGSRSSSGSTVLMGSRLLIPLVVDLLPDRKEMVSHNSNAHFYKCLDASLVSLQEMSTER